MKSSEPARKSSVRTGLRERRSEVAVVGVRGLARRCEKGILFLFKVAGLVSGARVIECHNSNKKIRFEIAINRECLQPRVK